MRHEDYDTSEAEQRHLQHMEDDRRERNLDRQLESAERADRLYRRYVAAKGADS